MTIVNSEASAPLAQGGLLSPTFLQHVAHDIRGSAAVVKNALEALGQLELPTERADVTMIAERGIARLLHLSNRLALLAELQSGSIPERRTADLRPTVLRAANDALFLRGRRAIRLTVELGEREVQLPFDPRMMHAALIEVLSNAVRFAQSHVRVSIGNLVDRIELLVEDDGIGFAPNDSFETFLEANAKTPNIGCALAATICVHHGGEIRIRPSTLGPSHKTARGAAIVFAFACPT